MAPPVCKKCEADMTYAYAANMPARDAYVKVFYCLPCKETTVQTWVGGLYAGEGQMPLFAELRV